MRFPIRARFPGAAAPCEAAPWVAAQPRDDKPRLPFGAAETPRALPNPARRKRGPRGRKTGAPQPARWEVAQRAASPQEIKVRKTFNWGRGCCGRAVGILKGKIKSQSQSFSKWLVENKRNYHSFLCSKESIWARFYSTNNFF